MADINSRDTFCLKGLEFCLRPARQTDIPHLRQLWKDAFHDEDAYLDIFFRTAFAPARCRVLLQDRGLLGAAYWLECTLEKRRLAYVYAVAITPGKQGQGLGTALMEGLHRALAREGYDGVLLVPGSEGLRQYYRRFGYRTVSYHREFLAAAGKPICLTEIDMRRYSSLRRRYLPENGVVQERENLELLAQLARFYEGDGFAAVISPDDGFCLELLGECDRAGGIAAALGLAACRVRTAGSQLPYAMGKSLTEVPLPDKIYFGFGFD